MKSAENPILYRGSNILWILDSGHGINTKGKRSPVWKDGTQLMEWSFNRTMTNLIHAKAVANGMRVHILVQEDTDIPLYERAQRVKDLWTDKKIQKVVISNHANAADAVSAKGIEAFTYFGQSESDVIADHILTNLFEVVGKAQQRTDLSDGDLDKEANFAILRDVPCASVLIEYGFMSNEEECKKLMDYCYREKLADAVVNAMYEYENSKLEK